MIISCLGDSLTEGDYGIYQKRGIANVHAENYPYFLQKLTNAEVRNFGKCGYTATSFLNYFKSGKVDIHGSDLIIIMLGTNGGQSIDEDTQGNRDYIELTELCGKEAKVVLCTPPHVTENPEMSNCGYIDRVRHAVGFVKRLADERDIPLIALHECPDFTAENEGIMQPNDGLHFSEEGYRVMAGYIFDKLKELKII